MRRYLLSFAILLNLASPALAAQARNAGPPAASPREVVERLWAMAMRGELLTEEGWNRVAGLFTVPQARASNAPILVVSNYYGVNSDQRTASTADVQMEYVNCGQIDRQLRYSPAPKTGALKTSFGYRLISVPTYINMYGADGKTVVERKPTGATAWQIEGPPPPPWTTVNTAIRYVLEMRDKATDPVVKKNADATLAKLRTLH
jgi:hypothetical protein